MAESVLRQGAWWHQSADGSWSRWDEPSRSWVPQPGEPPEPLPHESGVRAQPAAPTSFAPLAGIGRVLLVMIVAGIVLDAVAVASGFAEYALLDRVATGELITEEEATSNDQRQAVIGLLQLGLYLVTAIVFITWFHRAYKNVRALDNTGTRFGTGWAIGGWFVPFLNLVRPKQIADEIWEASDPDRAAGDTSKKGVPVFVHLWWAAWIIGSILGQFAFRSSFDAESIESLKQSSAVVTASDAVNILVGILAAILVASITKRQEARAEKLGVPRNA